MAKIRIQFTAKQMVLDLEIKAFEFLDNKN